MSRQLYFIIAVLSLALMSITSCNSDDVITDDVAGKPVITFDNSTGVYEVKVGRELTVAPDYANAQDARYEWRIDGKQVAVTPIFTHTWNEPGEYYVTITVTNSRGSTTEEIRVEVVELGIPAISLPMEGNSVTILVSTDFKIKPEITYTQLDDFKVEWTLNGQKVSDEQEYTFRADATGHYAMAVKASNIDGSTTREFTIHVVDKLPVNIEFPKPSYFAESDTRYTFPGRALYIKPIVSGTDATSYSWALDGRPTSVTDDTYMFLSDTAGEYNVAVTVAGEYTASVKVVVVNANESSRRRAVTASSKAACNKVYEYLPAPGQFIGEPASAFSGVESTLAEANAYAEKRLAEGKYVSLGAWGGYVIVGFDHSVPVNMGVDNLAVQGNAFFNVGTDAGGSNEPGIIYVMQDVNGNGLPDDEWYELRGSETGAAGTWQDYAVTYYRPASSAMGVQWTDNRGNQGTVDYIKASHTQPYYYPTWVTADSYTLRGTRLQARTTFDAGVWNNAAFGWGYADNMGSDLLNAGSTDGEGQRNGIRLENAMNANLAAMTLQYIDFVKIQTGVSSKAGWTGEVSTEICAVEDLSIK